MASISGITATQPPDQIPVTSATTATNPLANQATFLTLLVSQLKNQDPTSPMDGTTFVTQLAQFSNLQQSLAIRQDTDALSSKITGTSSLTSTTDGTDSGAASTTSPTGATGTDGTTQTGSSS